MTDEAATGLDQTASVAPAAETNPTPAPEAPPVDNDHVADGCEKFSELAPEPEAPKSLFEQFVEYLKYLEYLEKELNEGEAPRGQLFQMHLRKNAAFKLIASQATGKASALTEFSVPKTEA